MIDFDIDDIREAIKDLPCEEKMAFLKDKEIELGDELEAIDLLWSDILSLEDEIQQEMNDKM